MVESQKLLSFLKDYMSIYSLSGTSAEREVPPFLSSRLRNWPYFQAHPEHLGTYKIPKDLLKREIFWALVKGKGERTVILLHHYDVVSIDNFGALQDLAFRPEDLARAMDKEDLTQEVREDLESGDYLFGRGGCDMKAGGTIQLACLEEFSKMKDFTGNVLLLAVPDEENLSAGMRSAPDLLLNLKKQFGLNYKLLVNSEPHGRKDPKRPALYLGSCGKLLFFVYVKSVVVHMGENQKGVSGLGIMSRILAKTDQNRTMTEEDRGEVTPPPVWVYLRDTKEVYDVSMPPGAFAAMNLISFKNNIQFWKDRMEGVIREAMEEQLGDNPNHFDYRVRSLEELPVGRDLQEKWGKEVEAGRVNYLEATYHLVKDLLEEDDFHGPQVVYGLVPPIYPSVISDHKTEEWVEDLFHYAKGKWGLDMESQPYFTGISDLSYTRSQISPVDREAIKKMMAFYGAPYEVPFEGMEALEIPAIMLGPWGKDLHLKTERVYKKDLLEVTPDLVCHLILRVLHEKEGAENLEMPYNK
ncbi:M20/M25/M40 family metallo-hydrolase [Kallipyga massiliensis]|uniref:M20/M25/M40 family metallo-hydrolase n=1 Tax=Kallipyga massiliensis TaxID=1472764 RepID=UPI0026F21754|nr:M20/M25/M40 family metallo-hydrolase [Kallipyga massiliensis]